MTITTFTQVCTYITTLTRIFKQIITFIVITKKNCAPASSGVHTVVLHVFVNVLLATLPGKKLLPLMAFHHVQLGQQLVRKFPHLHNTQSG